MKLLRLVLLLCIARNVFAGELTLRLGPAGVGSGGTNPLSIPPGPLDFDITWVTASDWETSFSVSPGILVGKRSWYETTGIYMGVGGGIILSGNGIGAGPYASVGWSPGEGPFRFNMEFKQSLGITGTGIISPYAFRIGASYDFK